MVMKKFLSLSMLAIAAMVAYSCEVEIEPTVKEKAFEPKVISAYTDDDVAPDTKTSLSGVSILWSTSDNIKGWDGASVHTSSSTAVSDGNKKADFTFSAVSVEDDLMILAYPAEKVSNIDDDYVYVNLPSTQIATANSFANQANIAVADGLTTTPLFKNVGGLLSFTINNDNISSVTLSANENLTGDAKVSTAALTFAQPTVTAGKKYVTVSGSIENGTTYYAVVYPGTYTGLKIEVINTSGQIATYTNPNALTVERNGNLHIATLTIPDSKWNNPEAYSWVLSSGDLGESANPSSSVSKGSPLMLWDVDYTWDNNGYLGWNSTNGLQIGSGSSFATSAIFTTSAYTGLISIVRINFTQAKNGNASVSVSVNGVSFECNGDTSANATDNTPTNFVFSGLAKGDVVITFTNAAEKAMYVKSIEINPELRTPVTLSFDQASIERTTSNYNEFIGQAVTASPNESDITSNIVYTISGDAIGTINSSSGAVTLNGTIGDATVTASFDGDSNYAPAQASYDISVISANIDYSTRQTSNVTLSTEGGTNASSAEVNSYDALKAGKTSAAGAVKITVPANTTNLHLHAAGWNGESVVLSITGATAYPSKISLTSNSGISGNTPFTLSDENSQSNDPADYYFNIEVPGIVSETQLTFTATSGNRFVIWGVNATEEEDNRSESGILWKKAGVGSSTDTASIEDADDVLPTIALYNPNGLPVLYSSSDPGVAEIVESGVNAGTITLVSDGETTISAVFNGNASYKPTTVTYTLTVSDNRSSYAFTTIAGLNGLVTDSSNNYSGYLTDAVVSFVPATNTAIVKDATGSVMIYNKSGHGLLQGQTYTGTITVTAIKYNNLYSEITAWTGASFSGSETPVNPESLALSALIGHYDDYQNAYVQVSGLTVTSVDGKNINVTDGANNYVVYDNTSSVSVEAGDVITAIGTVTKYQTTEEIKVWNDADVIVTSFAPKAITFTQPTGAAGTAGCSFTVSVGGSPITSGDTVASGTTVTLTATAGTDYEFTSWTVNGATVADGTSASTTFVMGTSAVTVSALFTSTNGGDNPTPSLQYTLDGTITATGNAYATASTLTQSNIGWKVVGNTEQNPWRIGGKGITGQDRAIYSTTAIAANITQINVTSGATASSLTVNSLTISVHNSASDAENGVNAIASHTVTSGIASSTVTFDKADNTSWAGKFYRIVYNVTRTSNSGNGYITFESATFYGTN